MEQRELIISWIVLLTLTAIVGVLSFYSFANKTEVIIVLSSIKFIIVALIFMELSKAHSFWKFIILSLLVIQVTILCLFL